MPLLRHARGLGMAPPAALPPFDPALLAVARTRGAALLSFRSPAVGGVDGGGAVTVDGLARPFRDSPPTGDVVCHAIEQDSPLAPLLLWDLAHALPVGAAIVMEPAAEAARPSLLTRGYFAPHLHRDADEAGAMVLRKLAPLPAETEPGLDAWTFGIPVGPEDATLLNLVVARVLALGVPRCEILLCGEPGPGFAHRDKVRIVGLDLPPAPPLNISAKKNRLAAEASHPNLCLFHDRILLPRDFMDAVRRFGDAYPLVAFQSLWFDDRWNALPRRYSDLGVVDRPVARDLLGMPRAGTAPSAFAPAVLPEVERTGFALAHPRRHVPDLSFVNGSLCLAKRAVWRACPQDEGLHWTEFEDVEHGLRAAAQGIPSRCNPWTVTYSLTSRPILSFAGAVRAELPDGRVRQVRAPLEVLPLPRKPLIKMARGEAEQRLARFAAAYLPAGLPPPGGAGWRGRHGVTLRLEAIVAAVLGASLPRTAAAVARFVADWERQVLLDQVGYHRRGELVALLLANGSGAKRHLLDQSPELLRLFAARPRGPMFHESLAEYAPPGSRFGALVAALQLAFASRRVTYHPRGWRGLRHAIRSALP
ncbi:MAG: hypothetical protein IT556_11545 [Acetobacteraceae bacterium]|nr:hypothetical protein [Acetobacteraceae bacterium]